MRQQMYSFKVSICAFFFSVVVKWSEWVSETEACQTFFTPPNVRSLDRIVGRRPGEMPADGRRLIRSPLLPLPPGVGTRPAGSPEPASDILNWGKGRGSTMGWILQILTLFLITFSYLYITYISTVSMPIANGYSPGSDYQSHYVDMAKLALQGYLLLLPIDYS